jgi:hypothetical protein
MAMAELASDLADWIRTVTASIPLLATLIVWIASFIPEVYKSFEQFNQGK